MEPENLVAQKKYTITDLESPIVTQPYKSYDEDSRKFKYWHHVTQYRARMGGEVINEKWNEISKYAYDIEDDGNETRYNNHP